MNNTLIRVPSAGTEAQQTTEVQALLTSAKIATNAMLGVVLWDYDLENVGLPFNMFFGFGSEFGSIIYRLQKPTDNIRWCIFSVDSNYYIIKQQEVNSTWCEVWTKQMDKELSEAKKYCEDDAFQHYA